jgi:hypothetical protein
MAQANFTPISLYFSTVASAIPVNTNLVNGELAINITDGKLYYKDNAGVVKLLASNAAASGVTSISFGSTGLTPSTATGSAVTVAGTLITSNGGTGLSSYTAGDLLYYASGTALSKLAKGTTGYILAAGAAAPNYIQFVPVANGGTNSGTQSGARSNLGAAASGANTDITSIALTTGTITTAPVGNTDIVNKLYADSIAEGINFHEACSYATTANLGTVTYNNGSSGVGATLTNAGAQAALAIDGYTFTGTDTTNATRVLVKNQTSSAQNGVYTVTNQGSGSTNWVLTRATDFDTTGTGVDVIAPGDFFLIVFGSLNASTAWVQQTPLPITIGTTGIVFVQFGGASGGVTSFSGGTTGLTPNTATAGAITLAGTLATSNGGTGLSGATPFTANGILYASSTSALASGSALTFNGTNLATTGSATAASFIPTGTAVPTYGVFKKSATVLGLSAESSAIVTIYAAGGVGIGTNISSSESLLKIDPTNITYPLFTPSTTNAFGFFNAGGTFTKNGSFSQVNANSIKRTTLVLDDGVDPYDAAIATTLYIENAPFASGLTTITDPYALYVAAGKTYLGNQIIMGASTLLSSIVTGAVEYDGAGYFTTGSNVSGRGYSPSVQFFRLTSDGSAIGPSINSYFGSNSTLTFSSSGFYELEATMFFLKTTAGTVTFTMTFSNAPINNDAYYVGTPVGGVGTVGSPQTAAISKSTATAGALPATGSLTTAVDHQYTLRSIFQANASGGTLTIRITSSSGSVTPRIGSYFKLTRLPAVNTGYFV